MAYRVLRFALACSAVTLAATPGRPALAEAEEGQAITLETVTVTARRREEAAQEAPVAVTVITADAIGRGAVDDLEDAAFGSLNTVFSPQGGPLTIRGIGSLGISGGVDRQPAVGVFLDDVYIARPFGYPAFLDDAARIEVVRGSQSTLYGKNTIGGAVNLILREPGDPGIELEGSLGTGPAGRVKATVDAPLEGSNFEVRASLSWTGGDGFIDNRADGETVSDTGAFAGRAVLAGPLGLATDLKVSVDYTSIRDDGGLWYAPLGLAFDHATEQDYPAANSRDIGGLAIRLDHAFEGMALTAVSALRGHEMDAVLDGDFTAFPVLAQAQTEWQRQISQEIRLASTGAGRLRWLGGLYYMHEMFDGDQFYELASVPRALWSRTTYDQTTDTYAVFGELGYRIVPAIELVGGLRYTHEEKSAVAETSTPSGTFMFGTPGKAVDDAAFDDVSPELALNWRFAPGDVAYAKVSRGYKSGGISPFIDVNGQPNRYDPEVTVTYEVGAKTTWWGDRLTLNAALFHIDWQDQQAVVYTSPVTRVIRNAAAATSQGFEIEGAVQLGAGLGLSAGYGWLDATYDDFRDAILGADHAGNRLPYAPRHSVSAGAHFGREIGGGLFLSGAVDYAFRSSYAFSADNAYLQGETHIVGARLGLEGERWAATVWGRNLTDESYLSQYFSMGGTDYGVAAEGRTLGVTLKVRL
ncbi:TonB-dependent receptor [Zavarzinia compransoris]|uniref:TonB-dependent receptor n=1 Tax=Zavarzinia compransoris TaxID=1264899 RepID=A0A317E4K3_9PROT|nr:TonB-dependent receptor [Zavarzinia compransoris]PWR19985.1 TonB-dependent receptor [Zavarzinia compransoris]TDP44900.1 iron complex outermembrane receptor protein [Zavarzinia compransoris]